MSQILILRDTIVSAISAVAPGLDVTGHLGRFDEGELRAFMLKAPGVRVSVLGLEDVKPDAGEDTVNLKVRLGLYVVTKDGAKAGDRVGAALGLTEAIVLLCVRNRWGLGTFVRPAEVAGAQLIFSQAVRDSGVALWAIDLRQPIQLSDAPADTGVLLRVLAGLAPNIGTGHEPDYVPFDEVANG